MITEQLHNDAKGKNTTQYFMKETKENLGLRNLMNDK
jgi:hypothetical protein